MFVYKEPTDEPVRNIEEDPHVKRASYITGDRMSTFMIYLSEVGVMFKSFFRSDTELYTIWNYFDLFIFFLILL